MRKEQAARTEAELKVAAVRVFAREGYLNAKITGITAEAGRATGSFYQHFAGKEKLLEALLADLLAESDDTVGQPGHLEDFADRAAVRWHVATFWAFYRRNRPVLDALQQAASVDATFADRMRQMIEPDVHHLAGHLRHLDVPGDPLVVASMLTSLMFGFASTWLSGAHPDLGRELGDGEAIETLTDFVYGGIGAARVRG